MVRSLKMLVGSIAFVALVLGLCYTLIGQEGMNQFLAWLDMHQPWSLLWFVVIMALVVPLLLPGLPLTTGAGFVFGVSWGTTAVVVGTSAGAFISFLVARYLFSEQLRHRLRKKANIEAIHLEYSEHAFKIVLLTRLVPFFPFKLSNYVFGALNYPQGHFLAATAIGIIPFSLHNVYLGSVARALIVSEHATPVEDVQLLLYIAGFLFTVVLVAYLNRLAKRALDKSLMDAAAESGMKHETEPV